ncbi:TonB-dependent receptor domain-containing protein, partial [Listeria seeligeri]
YLSLPALEAGLDPRSTQFNNPGFGSAKRNSLVFNRTPANGEEGWYLTAYAEQLERTRGISTSAIQHTVGYDDRDIFGGRIAQNIVFGERASLTVGADIRRDRGDALRQIYVNRLPTANYINNQDLNLLTYGIFAQAQYRPVGSLKLLGGLRYDRFD